MIASRYVVTNWYSIGSFSLRIRRSALTERRCRPQSSADTPTYRLDRESVVSGLARVRAPRSATQLAVSVGRITRDRRFSSALGLSYPAFERRDEIQ